MGLPPLTLRDNESVDRRQQFLKSFASRLVRLRRLERPDRLLDSRLQLFVFRFHRLQPFDYFVRVASEK